MASSVPVGVLYLPKDTIEWLLIAASVASVALEAVRGLAPGINDLVTKRIPVFKPKERFEITGATYLLVAATLVVFAFDKDVAVFALLFLAVGDPLAALVGGRDHRARIFGKSVAGTAAFVIGATLAGVLATNHPDLSMVWWLVPGAIVAAVVELLPIPIDDNLSIPLAAASAMAVLAVI